MIKIAKQRSKNYGNIDYQIANILNWKLPLEEFDAIAFIATLHH